MKPKIIGDNVKVGMSDPTDIRINVPLRLEDGVHDVGFANSVCRMSFSL